MPDNAQKSIKDKEIRKNTEELLKRSLEMTSFYDLGPNENLKEITQDVLLHKNISNTIKYAINESNCRYYVFSYPSDGLKIKAFISIPGNVDGPIPLIISLRGGNRLFCLPHPDAFTAQPGYSVVATTNRGGVSEGEDEFGGDDVNDTKNLFEYIPTLEKILHVKFHPTNKYMVGLSRGGMQMFLALERFPSLQKKVRKIVSITGMLNLKRAIDERLDVKNTFINEFGLTEDENGKAWIAYRQPFNYINMLSKKLPILIVQGTKDIRVSLEEGYDMRDALLDANCDVTYIEVKGANHMLENSPEFIHEIIKWLEK